MPFFLRLYRLVVRLLAPAIRAHIHARVNKGKEDAARLQERWGGASTSAFTASPYWIHAASVGEATAALTLIQMIRTIEPARPILLTTGTMTSAKIVADRLPENTVHQYAPYDHPDWIKQFLDYWQPCANLRLESELWPNTLIALKNRHIPTALINARLSIKSFNRWRYVLKTIQYLLSSFSLIIADGEQVTNRLKSLGASNIHQSASIKFLATPPDIDHAARDILKDQIGPNRTFWLYASSHADEENIAATIHAGLKQQFPDLLTIISPRHPSRRDAIARALASTNLNIAWRSKNEPITATTDIYIADTMGEQIMLYALAPLAVIGRSFSRDGGGGHNPIEAAMMGCYPLSGPHVQNLDTVFETMIQGNAAEIVPDPGNLTTRLADMFSMTDVLNSKRNEAKDFVTVMRSKTEDELRTHLVSFLSQVAAR